MILTVAVTVCHLITSPTAPDLDQDNPEIREASHLSLCHEEVVVQGDTLSIMSCMFPQGALAQWKEASRFAGPSWYIRKIRCIPGSYSPKDNI